MDVIGFAFVLGIFMWLVERREIAATRRPAPCHACYTQGEIHMVHMTRKGWVHTETGQQVYVTKWALDMAQMAHRDPLWLAHPATPRTARDERLAR